MKRAAERQRGAVIVFSAIWLVAFFTFVALALNIYFLGTMLLQQRNAAEYVALAAVKLMTSPPANRRCQSEFTDYYWRAACIAARSSVAAAVPMLGTKYNQQVERGQLTPQQASFSTCSQNTQPDPQTADNFSWLGFSAPASPNGYVAPRGYVILGSYNATSRAFSPACPAEFTATTMPTAAFVRINLKNNGNGDLVMPFITFLGGAAGINFSSSAIAYLDGDLIMLAKDPSIQ
jgi:hypothetical protein